MLATLVLAGCTGRFSAQGGWAAPLVSGDTLYVGTRDGRVLALDRDTGNTRWRFPREGDIQPVYSSPVISEDEILYVGGYDGNLYAIDTGEIEQRGSAVPTREEALLFSSGGSIIASPVVTGEIVLLPSSDGFVYALNPSDGSVKWKYETQDKVWSTPGVDGGRVYFGSLDHTLYALDTADGSLVWDFSTKGAIASKPLVMGDNVYVGSFEGVLYSIGKATGQEEARFQAENWLWATPVYHDSTVYVGSLDHRLYALDALSLEPIWAEPLETEGQIVGAPAIVGDWIAVPSDDRNVYVVRASDGRDRHVCAVGDRIRAPLAVSGDVIYVFALDNSVRAIRIDPNGDPNELWTRFTDRDEPEPRTAAKAC